MMSSLAAAMNASYENEALYGCCLRGSASVDECYPTDGSGIFHADFASYLDKCSRWLYKPVLKADEMTMSASRFMAFARTQGLQFQCIFLVRHPFNNIRSLQSFAETNDPPPRLKEAYPRSIWLRPGHEYNTSVVGLALTWKDFARAYIDAPAGTFAAVMRYEDLMAFPVATITALYTSLTGRNVDFHPQRTAIFKNLQSLKEPRGDYAHAEAVRSVLSAEEAQAVVAICGEEMRHFDYAASDVFSPSPFLDGSPPTSQL